MYADDLKLVSPIDNSLESSQRIQEDINRLYEWCNKWGMTLNPQKCAIIYYTPKNLPEPEFYIDETKIDFVEEARDLGVTITKDLKFHSHISKICMRAKGLIGRVKRCFTSRNSRFILKLYTTYVRPVLEYAAPLWNPTYLTDIRNLETVQRRKTKMHHGNEVRKPTVRRKTAEARTD